MPVRPLRLHGVVLPTGDRRDLFVDGGRLSFTPIDGAETVVEDGWLIPGLVDAHAHLALASPAPEASPVAAAVRASAKAQLDAGVLVIREPGGPSRDSREIGPHEQLPRVFSGGRFLAAPGGYFPGMAREVEPGDLAAAAVEESRASGHWAKVVGDFIDGRGVFAPTFELGALRAAVEAVHAIGGRLAIHAMTAGAIEMAIEAGVDSIEHATELAPEHLPAIARKGIALVPTMLIREPILATARGMGLPDGEQRGRPWTHPRRGGPNDGGGSGRRRRARCGVVDGASLPRIAGHRGRSARGHRRLRRRPEAARAGRPTARPDPRRARRGLIPAPSLAEKASPRRRSSDAPGSSRCCSCALDALRARLCLRRAGERHPASSGESSGCQPGS